MEGRFFRGGVFVMFALACVAAGCGSGSQSQSEASSIPDQTAATQTSTSQRSSQELPNPCVLLTTAEIRQSTGATVEEPTGDQPERAGSNFVAQCSWNEPSGGLLTVSVAARNFVVEGSIVDPRCRNGEAAFPMDATLIPFDGLGIPAWWVGPSTEDMDSYRTVCIEHDDVRVTVTPLLRPEPSQAEVVSLAKLVVSRL
ncbi:DUF3558 family protein [Mycobacterium sp. SMC-4]|uniref:DUF3558 family protein n=1 Tax=Mycobacterium sp. SMC-4 TaxID=2857059 RepID=UPI0037CB06A4